MTRILVISDSHISPLCPDIIDWVHLGEYVVETRPDYIVHLGDVADLSSLAWMKSARGDFTTEEEMVTVSQHLFAFEDVLQKDRDHSRHSKKKIYRPKKVLCLGNHDVRNGFTGIDELFTDCGWEVHDYLEPVEIAGIFFSHCMMRGTSDQPCTDAAELLANWHSNVVVGHSHHCDYSESFGWDTGTIRAIKCPMFNRYDTGWAKQTNNKWSRGFTEISTEPFEFIWRDMSCLDGIC